MLNEGLAGPDALPCPLCPALLLRQYLESAAGRVIFNVLELDFALQAGLTVTLDQLSYPEFLVLRVLNEERVRLQKEELDKARAR